MPQTNANESRELARNSTDCSFLLTHLIRQNDGKSDTDAKNRLELILNIGGTAPSPMLKSSTVGWYGTSSPNVYNPATGNFDGGIRNKAVCFTESTLAGLKAHRDLFSVKYGLAFDREDLFSRGANPCINISESILRANQPVANSAYAKHLYNFIPERLHPFVNIIHDLFDATHEREWRYPDDLNFNLTDLRFVFCPETEFQYFSAVQTNVMPCLFDLAWLDRI